MTHKKPHLPEKICQHCGRPFAWRKKWAKNWPAVLYCSRQCRSAAGKRKPSGP